jgi:hypothetical protein
MTNAAFPHWNARLNRACLASPGASGTAWAVFSDGDLSAEEQSQASHRGVYQFPLQLTGRLPRVLFPNFT